MLFGSLQCETVLTVSQNVKKKLCKYFGMHINASLHVIVWIRLHEHPDFKAASGSRDIWSGCPIYMLY